MKKSLFLCALAASFSSTALGADGQPPSFNVGLYVSVQNICLTRDGDLASDYTSGQPYYQYDDGQGESIFLNDYSASETSPLVGRAALQLFCNHNVRLTRTYDTNLKMRKTGPRGSSGIGKDFLDVNAVEESFVTGGGTSHTDPYSYSSTMKFTIPTGQWGASAGVYYGVQKVLFSW